MLRRAAAPSPSRAAAGLSRGLQPPPATQTGAGMKPWEQLRALGGRLLAAPGESMLHDEDFEALR